MKVNPDNKLEKLFERLRQDGWYCGWGLACCQSCAWDDVPFEHEVGPFKGESIDFDKCLFNHEQDCEMRVLKSVKCVMVMTKIAHTVKALVGL